MESAFSYRGHHIMNKGQCLILTGLGVVQLSVACKLSHAAPIMIYLHARFSTLNTNLKPAWRCLVLSSPSDIKVLPSLEVHCHKVKGRRGLRVTKPFLPLLCRYMVKLALHTMRAHNGSRDTVHLFLISAVDVGGWSYSSLGGSTVWGSILQCSLNNRLVRTLKW